MTGHCHSALFLLPPGGAKVRHVQNLSIQQCQFRFKMEFPVKQPVKFAKCCLICTVAWVMGFHVNISCLLTVLLGHCNHNQHTHLVIKAHLIECNVYSECGGIVVWSQSGLLIWLISNYKGQVKLSLQTQTERSHASIRIETAHLATHTHRVCVCVCTPPSQLLLNKEKHQLGSRSSIHFQRWRREAEREVQISCIIVSCSFYYLPAPPHLPGSQCLCC